MSERTRSWIAGALLVAGALVLAVAVLVMYASHVVLDRDAFAKTVTTAVKEPAVREAIVGDLADAVIRSEPDLLSFRPLAIGLGGDLIASGDLDPIVHRAAIEAHEVIFERGNSAVVLDLGDGAELIASILAVRAPDTSEALRVELEAVVARVNNRSFAARTLQAAEALGVLRWALPVLGALLLAAAVLVSPDRRRAVLHVGLVVGGCGLLLLLADVLLRWVVPGRFDDPDLVHDVLDAFLAGAPRWAIVLLVTGAVICAAAWSHEDAHESERLLGSVGRFLTDRPVSGLGRALRGLALAVAGLALVLAPLSMLAAIAFVLGFVVLVDGVAELVALLAGRARRRPAEEHPVHVRRHRLLAAGLAALVVVAALSAGTVALASSGRPVQEFGDVCNGAAELCDRPLDRVTFPASHNSMSSARMSFVDANNLYTIEQQLDSGIRGLLVDTHLARPTDKRTIADTVLDRRTEERAAAEVGPEAIQALQDIVQRSVAKPTGPPVPYLCHMICELGAIRLVDALRGIRTWLDRNPRDVLVMIVQDAITVQQTEQAFKASGLLELAYTYRRGDPLPTLRQMIAENHRLFVMAELIGLPDTWYPPGYRYLLQETPYNHPTVAALRTDASCRPNRGKQGNPLFLVNHWVATYPPKPSNAAVVNQRAFLLDRVRRCARIRAARPNIVAVDFSNLGDVVGVARTLNGLGPAPTGDG
jgi:hypothetical protein